MLCLAPLIVKPPALLIADEISLGLAHTVTAKVMDVLSELRSSGVSILMVEEKAANVLKLADQVAFLSSGVVIRNGPVSDFTEEVAAEAYLGPGVKS
jgi:ABC-type branched-subunit amino acid transport system ATPase component